MNVEFDNCFLFSLNNLKKYTNLNIKVQIDNYKRIEKNLDSYASNITV